MLLGVAVIMMVAVLISARRQLFLPFAGVAAAVLIWIEFFGPVKPIVGAYSLARQAPDINYILKEPATIGCESVAAWQALVADPSFDAARSDDEEQKYLAAAKCRLIKNTPSLWWYRLGAEDNGKLLKLSSMGDGPTLIYKAADFAPR